MHVKKAYGGVYVQIPKFFSSALDGSGQNHAWNTPQPTIIVIATKPIK